MSATGRTREYADRMMTHASARRDGIEIIFADGCKGIIPFADVPEIGGHSDLSRIELPNPYEAVLYNSKREAIEVPWDFARHYCDPSYRPRVEKEAVGGRRIFGERVRQLRESAAITQEKLAEAAGIGRVTLVRNEKGEQSPRHETIIAPAKALGLPPETLLVAPLQTTHSPA